jgi:hypothetical protein
VSPFTVLDDDTPTGVPPLDHNPTRNNPVFSTATLNDSVPPTCVPRKQMDAVAAVDVFIHAEKMKAPPGSCVPVPLMRELLNVADDAEADRLLAVIVTVVESADVELRSKLNVMYSLLFRPPPLDVGLMTMRASGINGHPRDDDCTCACAKHGSASNKMVTSHIIGR